jgi:hypothetical protein
VTEEEWHEGVSVIDTIEFLALHELLEVVLHNRALMNSSTLCSGGVDTDAVTESEHVLEALVLESIRVHIDNALASCET